MHAHVCTKRPERTAACVSGAVRECDAIAVQRRTNTYAQKRNHVKVAVWSTAGQESSLKHHVVTREARRGRDATQQVKEAGPGNTNQRPGATDCKPDRRSHTGRSSKAPHTHTGRVKVPQEQDRAWQACPRAIVNRTLRYLGTTKRSKSLTRPPKEWRAGATTGVPRPPRTHATGKKVWWLPRDGIGKEQSGLGTHEASSDKKEWQACGCGHCCDQDQRWSGARKPRSMNETEAYVRR